MLNSAIVSYRYVDSALQLLLTDAVTAH